MVAGQEPSGVEGDAGGQAGHEQLGRGRALVGPAVGRWLVAEQLVAADLELEPVAGLVGDAEVGHRRSPRLRTLGSVSSQDPKRAAASPGSKEPNPLGRNTLPPRV